MGEPEVERIYAFDPPFVNADRNIGILRLFIDRMEKAGGLNTAKATLDGLRAVTRLSVVDQGRLSVLAARLAWKMGDLDVAMDGYEMLEEVGEREKEPELVVWAWIGYSTLAQLRGNYPRVQECCERVVSLATAGGFIRLTAMGHHGLTVAAAMRRDFDLAIVHAWQHYVAVAGDFAAERNVLVNVGQLMLDAGQPRAAQAALSRVVALRPPRQVCLLATGGLAVACALSGDQTRVRWIAAEMRTQAKSVAFPYELATALFECATALQIIGDSPGARESNDDSQRIARKHGYHEIVLRSESLTERIERMTKEEHKTLSSAAAMVVDRVEHLQYPILREQLSDAFVTV